MLPPLLPSNVISPGALINLFISPFDKNLPVTDVDVDVPQCPGIALFYLAVAIIIAQRFHHRLLGDGQLGFAAKPKAFCVFKASLSSV